MTVFEAAHQPSTSWPGSSRPSTSCLRRKVVDARDKSGHDGQGHIRPERRAVPSLSTATQKPLLGQDTEFMAVWLAIVDCCQFVAEPV